MSQAPSSAAVVASEDSFAGAPANPAGVAASGPSAPAGEAGSAGEAIAAAEVDRYKESVQLRGTTRGLEISVSGTPPAAVIAARLAELLAEAPSFFAGSTARVAFDGALPGGALACLEEVTTRFAVRIVEIGPVAARRRKVHVPASLRPDEVPEVHLAEGTGPIADEAVEIRGESEPASVRSPALLVEAERGEIAPAAAASSDAVVNEAAPVDSAPGGAPIEVALASTARIAAARPDSIAVSSSTAASDVVPPGAAPPASESSSGKSLGRGTRAEIESIAAVPPGPRLVIGPVRSGRIVDHEGHLIVIGDVNPGAEVRAQGSIIVLGRLRGVAHAAIGRDAGCIIALSLQPQQLRIGRMVARAADADRPSDGAEIAYATGETIVVERFLGRLPSGLAASM